MTEPDAPQGEADRTASAPRERSPEWLRQRLFFSWTLLLVSWAILLIAIGGIAVMGHMLYTRGLPRVLHVYGDEAIEQAIAKQRTAGTIWLDPNPRVGFRTIPRDSVLGTNRDGMRGPEWRDPKPPGERRVLLLGDSITYALFVQPEEGFAHKLQELLNVHAPEWRVYSAAVPGWNVRQEVEMLLTNLHQIQPDIVIHQTVSNDYNHARAPIHNTWGYTFSLDTLNLGQPYYDELVGVSAWGQYAAEGKTLPVPRELYLRLPQYRPQRRRMMGDLRRAADTLARLGIPYVVWLYQGDDAFLAQEMRSHLVAHEVQGWYFENPYTAPLAQDYHPNARTHTKIAEELLWVLGALPETGITLDSDASRLRPPTLYRLPAEVPLDAQALASQGEPVWRECSNRIDITTGDHFDQVLAGMWRLGHMFPHSEWVLRRDGEPWCVVEYDIPEALQPLLPFRITATISDFERTVTADRQVERIGVGTWRFDLDGLASDTLLSCRVQADRGAAHPVFHHVESWRLRRTYLTTENRDLPAP